jgi:hypothetical protein
MLLIKPRMHKAAAKPQNNLRLLITDYGLKLEGLRIEVHLKYAICNLKFQSVICYQQSKIRKRLAACIIRVHLWPEIYSLVTVRPSETSSKSRI